MPVMLERWNDDKMDAFKGKVDVLEAKVDGLSEQMREQRQETRELRQEMKVGFERVDERFEQMQRTMFNGVIALTSGCLAGFAALVVALH